MTTTAAQREIRRTAIIVGTAVAMYGLAFGAMGIAAGLTLAQTSLLSMLMFTGASQIAFVGVLGAGGAPITATTTAWLLGIRNAMYGIRLSTLLDVRGRRRALAAHLTIDESTALAIANEADDADARYGFYAGGISVWIQWNVATVIGALAARAVGDPNVYGLDAATAAGLLGLVWPRLQDTEHRLVALGAVAVALGLVLVAPAGIPVIASSVVAVVVALQRHRRTA